MLKPLSFFKSTQKLKNNNNNNLFEILHIALPQSYSLLVQKMII